MEKRCWGCNETKPISNFYKNCAKTDGHSSLCIECEKEYQKMKYVLKGRLVGIDWHILHKGKNKLKNTIRQDPCISLQIHAYVMKGDPDCLTTEFMQKIIGRRCQ